MKKSSNIMACSWINDKQFMTIDKEGKACHYVISPSLTLVLKNSFNIKFECQNNHHIRNSWILSNVSE